MYRSFNCYPFTVLILRSLPEKNNYFPIFTSILLLLASFSLINSRNKANILLLLYLCSIKTL